MRTFANLAGICLCFSYTHKRLQSFLRSLLRSPLMVYPSHTVYILQLSLFQSPLGVLL